MKRVTQQIAVGLIGLLTAGLLIGLLELKPRDAVLALAAVLVYLVAILSRRPALVLSLAWVVALTYGKAFFVYPPADDPDFHGIYWIYSDIFLAGLVFVSLFRRGEIAGRRFWPWLLPLLVASAASTLGAIRSDWALYDLFRLVKLASVAACMRANLGVPEWWACVTGLGVATVGQGILSILQVSLKNTSAGLLGLVGIGGADQAAQAQAQTQAMYGAMGGFFRAYGTIGHPANLASYFLFTLPLMLGLAFTLRRPLHRLLAASSFVIGVAGLACTQSRGPLMFAIIQVVLMLIALLYTRLTSIRGVVALSGIGVLLAAGLLYRFQDSLLERLNRDYDDSVELRSRDNATALQIFTEAPLIGVGLNNYSARILEYDPQWSWAFEGANDFQRQFNSRMFVAPHDLYAFLLAETGVLGLLGFLILVIGFIWVGYRGIQNSVGPEKAVCIGLVVGLFGQLAQSAINFSLWVDPLLFTFILAGSLLARVPFAAEAPLARAEPDPVRKGQ